jgi:hypothetical protein
MSDGVATRHDGPWAGGLAHARGLPLTQDRAEQVAALVEPTLHRFRALAAGLCADDDPYEFRRLLFRELIV